MLETTESAAKSHYFRMSAIFFGLTAVCVFLAPIFGMGPCGGAGLIFLLAAMPLALATLISLMIGCRRKVAAYRAAR